MNRRDRGFLDLAHGVQHCQNCERYTGGCEPAHENSISAGKGFGIKAHDDLHAALCHSCHAWLDQGASFLDPSGMFEASHRGKSLMWNRAHLRTMEYYRLKGWRVHETK